MKYKVRTSEYFMLRGADKMTKPKSKKKLVIKRNSNYGHIVVRTSYLKFNKWNSELKYLLWVSLV